MGIVEQFFWLWWSLFVAALVLGIGFTIQVLSR